MRDPRNGDINVYANGDGSGDYGWTAEDFFAGSWHRIGQYGTENAARKAARESSRRTADLREALGATLDEIKRTGTLPLR